MYLLDTHALLWFLKNDERLSKTASRVIQENDVMVSMATLWEIAIKTSLGKLILPAPFAQVFPKQLELNDIEILSTSTTHLAKLQHLEFHHRDPFDRLIIAQAMVEDMTLISKDTQFVNYGVDLLW